MDRRGFLSLLTAGAAGLVIDPDLLLWRKGAKLISLPPTAPSVWAPRAMTVGDIFSIQGIFAVNPVTGEDTGYSQLFTIVADVTGGDVSTDVIVPRIVTSGHYRNASGVLTPRARINPILCGQVAGRG